MIRNYLILMLVTLCISENLFAQVFWNFNEEITQKTNAERMFNATKLGDSRKRFEFWLPKGNSMILEFTSDAQVDSLPPIDSLMRSVWQDLQHLADSFDNDLSSLRVDVIIENNSKTIRWKNHPQPADVFRVKEGGVTQLKIEPDTLRIRIATNGPIEGYNKSNGSRSPIRPWRAYYITFLLNHLQDVVPLAEDPKLQRTIALFQQDFAQRKRRKTDLLTRYFGIYNVMRELRISPNRLPYQGVGRSTTFVPYIQLGVQYARGAWLPSAGTGLQLTLQQSKSIQQQITLLWEPHFLFNRLPDEKVNMQRQDFITFRYRTSHDFERGKEAVQWVQNFSLGYLIRRKGDFFEPNTFKFSLPGLQAKNLVLEPEFFFNGLVKNFSPSLKLTCYLE